MSSIVYGGLDVHQEEIVVYLLCTETGEVLEDCVPNDRLPLERAVRRWQKRGELRLCYEASSAGYVIQRWLDKLKVHCEVIAPSRIPRPQGPRIKTNRRDARQLATLYGAGLLTAVRVPSEAEEQVRSLLRLHAAVTQDMTRVKNRIHKFLELQGLYYRQGHPWTKKHYAWLAALSLEPLPALILGTHLQTLESLQERRQEVDRQIIEVAHSPTYALPVARLMCLRGLALYSALMLVCEVGDVRRFATAPQLMSYWGLVCSEHSSGEHRRQGHITKTGSSWARWVLSEAAWQQRCRPAQGAAVHQRRQGQPAEVVAIAEKAEERLHRKFWRIAARKDSKTAAMAVARELAGFVWALLSLEAH